ncbi:DUF998 domain-containing protein [Mycetocola reblochoni]|uniref:DUF998 domain-containing protein n=1 Tax=Mycetocola reblochoni REB411 TaxID=1255698 RepID=A0A1R4IJF4_9MICO|nr:DUF998 domain-containing protein [Mycetocola reblochoni]SJN19503.1 hypothetical protein FM119_01920 [Mycetocola reblochoni REB411]
MSTAPRRRSGLRVLALTLGLVLVVGATGVIWTGRAITGRSVYVSELGAAEAATATAFNAALLALGAGVIAVAAASRHQTGATARRTRRWTVRLLLLGTGAAFAVASRVPCSAGCPVPGSTAFTATDAVHLSAAVAGFALAGLAMIVTAATPGRRLLRLSSLVAVALMALAAAAGGLLSLQGSFLALGATLEFVAMTVAVAWFVPYVSAQLRPLPSAEEGTTAGVSPRAAVAAQDGSIPPSR